MKPNSVIRMLDAINDGREYTYVNNNVSEVDVAEDSVLFNVEKGATFEITNAEQAREIAGILVAWANAREDTQLNSNDMAAGMKLFGWLRK